MNAIHARKKALKRAARSQARATKYDPATDQSDRGPMVAAMRNPMRKRPAIVEADYAEIERRVLARHRVKDPNYAPNRAALLRKRIRAKDKTLPFQMTDARSKHGKVQIRVAGKWVTLS